MLDVIILVAAIIAAFRLGWIWRKRIDTEARIAARIAKG